MLLYNSKLYVRQLGKGEQYEERLLGGIFWGLWILALESKKLSVESFDLDEQIQRYYKVDFQFHFVELPKFKKTEKELKTVSDKWIYFHQVRIDLDKCPSVEEPRNRAGV